MSNRDLYTADSCRFEGLDLARDDNGKMTYIIRDEVTDSTFFSDPETLVSQKRFAVQVMHLTGYSWHWMPKDAYRSFVQFMIARCNGFKGRTAPQGSASRSARGSLHPRYHTAPGSGTLSQAILTVTIVTI